MSRWSASSWCRCGHVEGDHYLGTGDCSRCTCEDFSKAPRPPARSYVTIRDSTTGKLRGRRRVR